MYHKHYGPADVWRELAVPHGATLHDLHHAVLDPFQSWDDEHLYEWTAKDRSGRTLSFVHPECEWSPETDAYADAVTVGALDLPEPGTLNFTFDYGKSWRFVLKLLRVDPRTSELTLIASHGKSLPQYPGDEDGLDKVGVLLNRPHEVLRESGDLENPEGSRVTMSSASQGRADAICMASSKSPPS